MRGVVWFKKDLRTYDQPALFAATQECVDGVIAIYIIDRSMWQAHHTAHCQIEFILRGLQQLKQDLAELSISLLIETVTATKQIPELLGKISEENKISALYFNRELEINESRRDQAVATYLQKKRVKVKQYDDQLILQPAQVQKKDGDYFKIFTPFKRRWLDVFREQRAQIKIFTKPKALSHVWKVQDSSIPSFEFKTKIDPAHWPAGEKIAQKKLKKFTAEKLFVYDQERDFPFLDTTSHLSPYLAVGMLSVKECFILALSANNYELDTGNNGALTWMSELIWREFYRHILIVEPRVCMNRAYKKETEKLAWRYDEGLLKAWQEGKTGFPLVDAAMRQLQRIGWMHNRLRMVAAMFLSKNLFLDWRLGEKFFAEQLIDFDFASNNGGWQWCASTGTDAVPYFRIFNPESQRKRFDADNKFIRLYCPEFGTKDYPKPIIDYAASRARVLSAFKAVMKTY